MAKETYVRFRCTETEKNMIEAAAMQAGMNVSEYLLGMAMDDFKYLHTEELILVCYKGQKELEHESLGIYLFDEQNRASKYTTYKDVEKKAKEIIGTKDRRWKVVSRNGKTMTTNALSDFVVLE